MGAKSGLPPARPIQPNFRAMAPCDGCPLAGEQDDFRFDSMRKGLSDEVVVAAVLED